ncbi:sugar transferase [Desulfovibrio inopinatus]|uniref:sugar transferase n=1 Tax=Desulfovibrio inopinatus TaxID=102109 RepID=UPI0004103F56|nr:sugar transferase [Desulfovibrio inopinatus]
METEAVTKRNTQRQNVKSSSTVCHLDEMHLDGLPSELQNQSLVLDVVSRGLAILFLLAGLPLMICIAIYSWLTCSGPVLYKGYRLGKGKRQFTMYKFRTLPVGHDKTMGASIVGRKHHSIPPFYWFLRETRLDELPQLFNVVRGDMLLVGPRPLRPEVYMRYCGGIVDFDRRFWGKPGLIGVSQLLTPSNTPKRIRARLDNLFQEKRNGAKHTFALVAYTIFLVFRKVMVKGVYAYLRNIVRERILHKEKDRRFYERVPQTRTFTVFEERTNPSRSRRHVGVVLDINETTMRMYSNMPLHEQIPCITLKTLCMRHGREKTKTAHCAVDALRGIKSDEKRFIFCYIVDYNPLTPFSQYIVDKYILRKSMAG